MEKKYTDPKIEVVEVEDVIVTSLNGENETPVVGPGNRNEDWQ